MPGRDIGQIDAIARAKGWGRRERRKFSRLVEECKAIAGGRPDYSWDQLSRMADTWDCPDE